MPGDPRTASRGSRLDPWLDAYAARARGHDRLRDPRAVRRRQPARGRLARRRHAVPRGPAAGRWWPSSPPRWSPSAAPVALQYGSGQGDPRAARADLRGDVPGGHRRPPRRRRGHRRLAAWRWTWSRGSSATRATSCSPRHRPTSARSARSRRTRREVVHVAMDDDGLHPRGAGATRSSALPRRGRRIKFLYTIPNFHNPAGVTLRGRAGARCSQICQRGRHAGPRGQPVRPARLRRQAAAARCAPTTPTTWSTSARSPRRSPRACGSAGWSRRTPCARSWCWPTSLRPCARRRSTRC